MTQCNRQTLGLTKVDSRDVGMSRDVVADSSGGQLISDAGAVLMREPDRDLGLLDALDEAMDASRYQRYISHQQREPLAQFPAAIYRDLLSARGDGEPHYPEHFSVPFHGTLKYTGYVSGYYYPARALLEEFRYGCIQTVSPTEPSVRGGTLTILLILEPAPQS